MRAGELCNREVVIARPEESVVDAANLMRHHHVGDLVVVRSTEAGEVPVAILTDRDLVVEVLAGASAQAQPLAIGDVITRDELVTVSDEADVFEVASQMRHHGVRRIPVVSSQGTLIGILSYDDLVTYFSEQLSALVDVVERQTVIERKERP